LPFLENSLPFEIPLATMPALAKPASRPAKAAAAPKPAAAAAGASHPPYFEVSTVRSPSGFVFDWGCSVGIAG